MMNTEEQALEHLVPEKRARFWSRYHLKQGQPFRLRRGQMEQGAIAALPHEGSICGVASKDAGPGEEFDGVVYGVYGVDAPWMLAYFAHLGKVQLAIDMDRDELVYDGDVEDEWDDD
jgi:hypothetical protein